MHRFTCGEKKNLVKHQKVSKHYEDDCRFRLLFSVTNDQQSPLSSVSKASLLNFLWSKKGIGGFCLSQDGLRFSSIKN